jgi:hypothetical protein
MCIWGGAQAAIEDSELNIMARRLLKRAKRLASERTAERKTARSVGVPPNKKLRLASTSANYHGWRGQKKSSKCFHVQARKCGQDEFFDLKIENSSFAKMGCTKREKSIPRCGIERKWGAGGKKRVERDGLTAQMI